MPGAGTWVKMIGTGVVFCVGGPLLVQYVRPTDEELFKRYNPDLQKKSLEMREKRSEDFDEYVSKLKEWSKSDKSIWVAAKEWEAEKSRQQHTTPVRSKELEKIQAEQMRKEMQGGR